MPSRSYWTRLHKKGPIQKAAVWGAAIALLAQMIAVASPRPATAGPQPASQPFQLTIDNIMAGPTLTGYSPRAVRWSGDAQS
ncbi:MAG TPA: hypothetical protein VJX67_15615, partial [Blastocatellia bacterium]|nr:hypothetical protein [Blastocatellia bacterium]